MDGEMRVLRIEGMHCAGCSQAVERALRGVVGVRRARVDLIGQRALIEASADVASEALIAAVAAAGYEAARDERSVLPDTLVDRDIERGR